jgi:hypothetical protein
MQDLFGNVDDLLEMYAEKRASAVLGREEDEVLDPADEEDPDAVAAYEERLVRPMHPPGSGLQGAPEWGCMAPTPSFCEWRRWNQGLRAGGGAMQVAVFVAGGRCCCPGVASVLWWCRRG